jgi:hypothetical protein
MATATPAQTAQKGPGAASVRPAPEIRIYSHSPILYWWPVWVVGFALALVTRLDGGYMAYVPPGTEVVDNHLVAPEGTALEAPHDRMAASPYLGAWFFGVVFLVFVCSNVQLRGLWEWIAILAFALAISLISVYGLWGRLLHWAGLLHIHINMGGYVALSSLVLAVWLLSVFVFDRRTYIVFSAGQIRIRDEIGQAEKTYDATNLKFQIQPNILIRHRVLGFYGAGDLVVQTGGSRPETFEWPNVLFARSRLRAIDEALKARKIV